MKFESEIIEGEGYHELVELFFQRKWTDGLPVVPPTEEKVEELIRFVGRDPKEVLGEIPPYNGLATIEKIAVNSVMAGCLPEYFPVVIAAVEAMLDPKHNLNGTQVTQSGVEPLLIVNGPIVKQLGINYGDSVFGRGSRANGTIGRAIRLILWNLGQNFPGEPDRSTFSHPGSWSFCIAEDEDSSPWEPLHVERGLPSGSNAVTVFACEAPHPTMAHGTVRQILSSICEAIASPGSSTYVFLGGGNEILVTISALNAEQFRREGWSKMDVKQYIWEHTKVPFGKIENTGMLAPAELGGSNFADFLWPKWVDRSSPESTIPATLMPNDIHVMVCGGRGSWCAVCHGWGYGGLAVTREVRIP